MMWPVKGIKDSKDNFSLCVFVRFVMHADEVETLKDTRVHTAECALYLMRKHFSKSVR